MPVSTLPRVLRAVPVLASGFFVLLSVSPPGSGMAEAAPRMVDPIRGAGAAGGLAEPSDPPLADAGRTELEIREWEVPWPETRPRDPAVAQDGSVWFSGELGDYLGRLDPESGEMIRYELPEGTGPHGLVVDDEGYPWFAAATGAYLGRLDPGSGDVLRYDLPDAIRDPGPLLRDGRGDLWFTAEESGAAGFVGRFSPGSGEIEAVGVPGTELRPSAIAIDSQGRPWFAFMGSNRIGTLDPGTLAVSYFETPDPGSRIRRIGVAADDRIWWVDTALGFLGVFDPATGTMAQWQTPGGVESLPYALAVDDRDRIWFAETRQDPNRIVGFDPVAEVFLEATDIPSGGGSVRTLVFDPEGRALWFGTDANTVARARLP